MLRMTMLIVFTVAMSLQAASPVLALVPGEGLVVEGAGVPSIALGVTRAEVEAANGEPRACQSVEDIGDLASCSFDVDGGGQVTVLYRGTDGGSASASPDDVVHHIRWYEQVSGWTTTAGVNTTLAATDPPAVVDAYPDAMVTYTAFGSIYSVVDSDQGIEVVWVPDFYSGTTHVSMAIFHPRATPPTQETSVLISNIDLFATKVRGERQVRAFVKVEDEQGLAASSATVFASWTRPDGSRQAVQAVTSDTGLAYFEVTDARRGAYTLDIDDVELEGHPLDRENSVLSASIVVK
jgi:hypothetical protein